MNNISRRDLFAAVAMHCYMQRCNSKDTAKASVEYADALIAELDKNEWTECIRGEESAEFHQNEKPHQNDE